MLLDLRRRVLTIGPERAVADGALGFWKAIEEVWPKTRGQRCLVHKTANVLHKLPKSQQAKAKRALEQIWMAGTKKDVCSSCRETLASPRSTKPIAKGHSRSMFHRRNRGC